MWKKIALGVVLTGVIGVLVAGGVIRTLDKTGNVAEARGLGGQGRGNSEVAYAASDSSAEAGLAVGGNGRGGNGRNVDVDESYIGENVQDAWNGRGGSQRDEDVERQYLYNETVPEDWDEFMGVVTQAPAAGVDMVIITESGEELVIGTGPGYMESQGFVLEEGEVVQVQGFWEEDEFKATVVTRLSDGESFALRDESGRPAWAGGGRSARSAGGRWAETVPQVES